MRRQNIFPEEYCKTNRFSNSFYPFCINAWNYLDPNIRNLPNISQFKNALLRLIRPKGNSLYGFSDRVGIRLLTRLRVDFSDLKLHKYDHNFNCASPVCMCGLSPESTEHFFLHCQLYANVRAVLLDSVSEIVGNDVRVLPDQHLCIIFLYGSLNFNYMANRMILESSVKYIVDSKRFTK